jgi:hypothetical protein
MFVTTINPLEDFSLKQKRKGRPKKSKGAAYWGRLKPLIYFLNLNSFDHESIDRRLNNFTDTSTWNEGSPAQYFQYASELYLEIHHEKPENLKSIHRSVVDVVLQLERLVSRKARSKKRSHETAAELVALCQSCNMMNFKPHWNPLPDAQSGPLVDLNFTFNRNRPGSAKQYCYGLIIEACATGEIRKLRRCRHCEIFFLATENRQVFCKPQHARAYYDDPARAKERVYNSRDRRSKPAVPPGTPREQF